MLSKEFLIVSPFGCPVGYVQLKIHLRSSIWTSAFLLCHQNCNKTNNNDT